MRSGTRWLWLTGVVLGTLALTAAFAQVSAQSGAPLVWARDIAGDLRAIQISADEAVTWQDQGKRVFLLKGRVWIEQADAHFRASQAVVWLDEAVQRQAKVYHIDIFSDSGASLEVETKTFEAPRAMIGLSTGGEIKVKTFKSNIVEKAMPQDSLFQRALAARNLANPVQITSAQQTAAPALKAETSKPPTAPLAVAIPEKALTVQARYEAPQGQPTQQSPYVAQPPAMPLPPSPGAVQPAPVVPLPGVVQPAPVVPAPAPAPRPPVVAGPAGGTPPRVSIVPRTSQPLQINEIVLGNGEKATVLRPGAIIRIEDTSATTKIQKGMDPVTNQEIGVAVIQPPKIVEIEADRVVVWSRGDVRDLMGGRATQGAGAHGFEFYLSGNVEIRNKGAKDDRVIRCNEAYYDTTRNVSVTLDADLEVKQPGFPDAIHIRSPELHQLNAKLFEVEKSAVNGSKLPYGPGLYLTTAHSTLEEKRVLKKSIFDRQVYSSMTGEAEYEDQLIFKGKNVTFWVDEVPVFWLPYVQGDARDPLGPLESLSIGYSRVFGFQLLTSWNVYDLIGIDPVKDTRWRVNFDYLSERGPEIATDYSARGRDLFGISSKYDINVKAMGIFDTGTDILGGERGTQVLYGYPLMSVPITHPEWRGRVYAGLNWQDLPNNLTVQAQVAAISDKNFLDQFYNPEWIAGPNQETFAYVKQQENAMAWTFLFEPRIRNWITETQWLPKVDGYWIGQDFLNMFTYTTHASAGFGYLETTHQPPPPFAPTDFARATGRFDWWNQLDLPLQLGAFRVVPYGVFDATDYTQDINGDNQSRFYWGGGVRGSIPFSRLYPEIDSELFNLNGIYHKIVMGGNYYWAHSSDSHLLFPQLDRLHDDASDQAMRDIYPRQFQLNPNNAAMLNSGFFDPQLFALRKLVLDKVDTLDSIEVVQLDLRQRWQTKRGLYGQQHIIDWMTLDLSASFFPQPNRDNFGEVANFLEYDWSWHIGDRTTLFSSGWFDPHEGGARVWSIGTQLNRPDQSNLYIGYRQIDPLESKQVSASLLFPFSAKYSVGASTSYDFGVDSQINALTITRRGTDLQVSLGFTYNTILNNFGFVFEIVPNLLPGTRRIPGMGGMLMPAMQPGI